ncbi:response regulator [Salibacterium aidingense]|uniref:response regulator n=1 Tax=Salibacterium aidingense TaxID=384933 RepID=UPI00041F1A9E|nr:response regulator [Salibacterium aidingense]
MKTVMIADDSAFMRTWLKKLVENHNYRVIVQARDGEEAIKQYSLYRPQLVLLDITMPKVDGLQAIKGITALDPKASVVMCSSLATSSHINEAKKAGAVDFVVKPHFHGLIDILNRAAENHSPDSPS